MADEKKEDEFGKIFNSMMSNDYIEKIKEYNNINAVDKLIDVMEGKDETNNSNN